MNNLVFRSHLHSHLVAATALIVLVLIPHSQLLGNIRYVGDVTPTGTPADNDAGFGMAGTDLLIGDMGLGGIFIDAAPALDNSPNFFPLPLESASGSLGVGVDGVGRVELTDNSWDITSSATDALVIGDEGFGLLDLFTSSVVDVVGGTIIGNAPTGQGQITINTIASRFKTGPLTVGEMGVGSIDMSFTGSIVSGVGVTDSIIGNLAGSMGTVTLNDSSRWDLRGPLTVGTAGSGFLNVNGQALLQANDDASVSVGVLGRIDFGGGTLRQLITNTTPIANSGVIRGDGFIDAAMDISSSGQLRNAAATANEREHLLVSGAVTNAGLIESIGGEMEFLDLVTNDNIMVVRDAIMRFRGSEVSGTGDLINNDRIFMGGNSTLYGDFSSSPGTFISIDPFSTVNIIGSMDLAFTSALLAPSVDGELAAMSNSTSTFSFAVGENASTVAILGDLSIGSGTVLELDFSSSTVSQPGDSYQVLSANNVFGTFANTQAIADGRFWDVTYDADEIFVTATNQLVGAVLGDFNADSAVNGSDLLVWQQGFGGMYNGADFANWNASFGTSAPPSVAASTGAVPEPTSIAMLLLGSVLIAGRRSRRVS